MIDWNDNKLTPEIKRQLKSGTKIKFKWYGNDTMEYVGRIEVNYDELYWVPEIFYNEQSNLFESMRHYNRLESFFHFTYFEILN